MIKRYEIGIMVYLFEVETETYKIPHTSLGLTPMTQKCYIPVAGSIARYEFWSGLHSIRAVNEELDFPEDGCKDPNPFELEFYEQLNLV